MMTRTTTTHFAAAAAGFALGYLGFDLMVAGEMTLHRVAAGLIMGLIGSMAMSGAAAMILDRHSHRPL